MLVDIFFYNGSEKNPQIKQDNTKREDIRYVFQNLKRKNVVKRNPLSISQIYKQVAEMLHVSRVIVLDTVERKTQNLSIRCFICIRRYICQQCLLYRV